MQEKKTSTSHFNFLSSGYFTLTNKNGEPYYETALPLLLKVISHLIWMALWTLLILLSPMLLSKKFLHFTDRLLMSLIIMHLFILGCRLTTLFLKGGLKLILFPPLEIRLTRQFTKGQGYELLVKHNLENHAGLLTNLAIAHFSRQEYDEAKKHIKKAVSLSDNTNLQQLASLILTHNS